MAPEYVDFYQRQGAERPWGPLETARVYPDPQAAEAERKRLAQGHKAAVVTVVSV